MMKIPCCSVCQTRYNEDDRCPLMLQCGHAFCKDCLSRMFTASPDTTLSCPRCRHISIVGNSVQALRKNYAILALIHSHSDFTDEEDDDFDDELEDHLDDESRQRRLCSRPSRTSSSGCGSGGSGIGSVVELSSHKDLRLIRRIGDGRRAGVEMWGGVLSGGRCRHRVAVKKVMIGGDDTDLVWVQTQLENLRRASMWCRNVCAFYGAMKTESNLSLIMDRCNGSVETEMQRNGGRLTLEQILRIADTITPSAQPI